LQHITLTNVLKFIYFPIITGMEAFLENNTRIKQCTNETEGMENYKKFRGLSMLDSELASQCLHPCLKTSYKLTTTDVHINSFIDQGCPKIMTYNILGGYNIFKYNTKLIKSSFNLPPHNWINIKFQVILGDNWKNNTLLVEIDKN